MAVRLQEVVPRFANSARADLRPVDPSKPCGGRMKGFALLHLFEWAKEQHGPEVMDAWRLSLEPKLQDITKPSALTSVGWVPVELYFSGVQHLVNTKYGGDLRRALDIGHALTSRDIGAFFRTALQFASPATVLSLSGRFWRSYFDFGSMVVLNKTSSTADVEIRDWPLPAEVAFHELAGSSVAWMESSKGKNVRITRFDLASPMVLSLAIQWS